MEPRSDDYVALQVGEYKTILSFLKHEEDTCANSRLLLRKRKTIIVNTIFQADTVTMRGVISDWGKIVNEGDERRDMRKVIYL